MSQQLHDIASGVVKKNIIKQIENTTEHYIASLENLVAVYEKERSFYQKTREEIHKEILQSSEFHDLQILSQNLVEEWKQNMSRIEELGDENARLKKRVAELENTAHSRGWDDIPYTLWREVLAMRDAGMTDKQIAMKLNDKGQGVSQSQLGALLYTGKEKVPASKTLQNNGTKLFQ